VAVNDGIDFMRFSFGRESKLNLFGKIVCAPIILLGGCAMALFDFIFCKRGG
jgi:hypothetical protein